MSTGNLSKNWFKNNFPVHPSLSFLKYFFSRFGKQHPVSFQLWKNYKFDQSKAKYFHFKYLFDHPVRDKLVLVSENLTHLLGNLTKTILSPTLGSLKCTIMSIFNLAEPEWISVSCLRKVPTNVVCFNVTSSETIHINNRT